jgi:hypothetical protein
MREQPVRPVEHRREPDRRASRARIPGGQGRSQQCLRGRPDGQIDRVRPRAWSREGGAGGAGARVAGPPRDPAIDGSDRRDGLRLVGVREDGDAQGSGAERGGAHRDGVARRRHQAEGGPRGSDPRRVVRRDGGPERREEPRSRVRRAREERRARAVQPRGIEGHGRQGARGHVCDASRVRRGRLPGARRAVDDDAEARRVDEGLDPGVAGLSLRLRGGGHRDGRPEPRVAERLGPGAAGRPDEEPRLALPPLDADPPLDDGRAPGQGRAIDLRPDGVAAGRFRRALRGGDADGEGEPRVHPRGARRAIPEPPPGRALRRVARVGRSPGRRVADVDRRGRVGDLDGGLLPGEGRRRGDALRRARGEVPRGEVQRHGHAPAGHVRRGDDRSHARRRVERREA